MMNPKTQSTVGKQLTDPITKSINILADSGDSKVSTDISTDIELEYLDNAVISSQISLVNIVEDVVSAE